MSLHRNAAGCTKLQTWQTEEAPLEWERPDHGPPLIRLCAPWNPERLRCHPLIGLETMADPMGLYLNVRIEPARHTKFRSIQGHGPPEGQCYGNFYFVLRRGPAASGSVLSIRARIASPQFLDMKTSAGSLKRALNLLTCSKVSLRCLARNMDTALSDPN